MLPSQLPSQRGYPGKQPGSGSGRRCRSVSEGGEMQGQIAALVALGFTCHSVGVDRFCWDIHLA